MFKIRILRNGKLIIIVTYFAAKSLALDIFCFRAKRVWSIFSIVSFNFKLVNSFFCESILPLISGILFLIPSTVDK